MVIIYLRAVPANVAYSSAHSEGFLPIMSNAQDIHRERLVETSRGILDDFFERKVQGMPLWLRIFVATATIITAEASPYIDFGWILPTY